MVGFLFRAVLSMLGLWLATRMNIGIQIDDPRTLVLAGLVLGIVNAIVRPIAVILTLGFFLVVVNAGMLGITAWLLTGFRISSFWGAVLASLVVSLMGWIGSWFIGPRGRFEIFTHRR